MLHVFHLDGGRMHNFDVGLSAETVRALQIEFCKLTRVPVAEQVLLVSGGEILYSNRPLSSYTGAGTESNPIFLIAKSTITDSAETALNQSDYKEELQQLQKNVEELEKEVEQCIGRVPSFTFLQCYANTAKKIERSCQELVCACSQLVNEQHLLHQGWCSVVANLEDAFATFFQRIDRFRRKHAKYARYREEARKILLYFNDDLQLLKKVPLLPCLVKSAYATNFSGSSSPSLSSGRPAGRKPHQTLFDWISSKESEHSLLEFADDVREVTDDISDAHVISRVDRWHDCIKERSANVQMKEIRGLGQRLVKLSECLQKVLKTKDEQSEYREYITKQEQQVMSCGDKTVLDDVCSSVSQALQEMSEKQKYMVDLLERFYMAKLELLKNIRRRLTWVFDTHELIQNADSKVMLHSERICKIRRQFELLRQLHEASALYTMAAGEVVRRRCFSQEYQNWSTRLMLTATQVRDDELQRRNWFGRKLERHFLKSLFPGMGDTPPNFFAPKVDGSFDQDLPPIDLSDLNHIRDAAPELARYLQSIAAPEGAEVPDTGGKSSSFSCSGPFTVSVPIAGADTASTKEVLERKASFSSNFSLTSDDLQFSPIHGAFASCSPDINMTIDESKEVDNGWPRMTISEARSEPIKIPQRTRSSGLYGFARLRCSGDMPLHSAAGRSSHSHSAGEYSAGDLHEMSFESLEASTSRYRTPSPPVIHPAAVLLNKSTERLLFSKHVPFASSPTSALESQLEQHFGCSSLPEFQEPKVVTLQKTGSEQLPSSQRGKLVSFPAASANLLRELIHSFRLEYDAFTTQMRAVLLSFKDEANECFETVRSYVQQMAQTVVVKDGQSVTVLRVGPKMLFDGTSPSTASVHKAVPANHKTTGYLKKLLNFSLSSLRRKDQIIRMLVGALASKAAPASSVHVVDKTGFFDHGLSKKFLCCHSVGAFDAPMSSTDDGVMRSTFARFDSCDDAYTLFRSRSTESLATIPFTDESANTEPFDTRVAAIDSVLKTLHPACYRRQDVPSAADLSDVSLTVPIPVQLSPNIVPCALDDAAGMLSISSCHASTSKDRQDGQLLAGVSATVDCLLSCIEATAAASKRTADQSCQTKADWKISVTDIEAGDLVLVVYDLRVETFVVFCLLPQLYILTESSLCSLNLCKEDGARSNNKWKFGRIIKKEYCQIKKSSNKYKLEVGCKFYRVEVQPVKL